MKKLFNLLALLSLPALMFAQSGKVFDNLSMTSEILKSERKYSIYLPPDYDTSERSYPVLYLLHGGGNDHTAWIQLGTVQHITDKAIAEGKCIPMIIVMPDANTGRRGYFNSVDGEWLYEDFFFEEFMPYVEDKFPIRKQKRYRAIAGLSMGGGGTYMYALHHPELFGSACPLSAGVGPLTVEATADYLKRLRGVENATKEQCEQYFHNHSALELVKRIPEEEKNSVRWYIDCGDEDFLYEGNALMHIALRKREIEHEFRIRDGKHRWYYWREALPEVLDFVSEEFHR